LDPTGVLYFWLGWRFIPRFGKDSIGFNRHFFPGSELRRLACFLDLVAWKVFQVLD